MAPVEESSEEDDDDEDEDDEVTVCDIDLVTCSSVLIRHCVTVPVPVTKTCHIAVLLFL